MRLTVLLIAALVVTACGGHRAVVAPVTVTVTKTAPSPVRAKPTSADRVAISRAVHAAACPKGDSCEITDIRFARSDSSYARASVYDPNINAGLAVLHRKDTRWKVIDLGTAYVGCDNTPRTVHRELVLVCPGEKSGSQQAAPPPPTATVSEFSPSDPYSGRPGDKHFAVYYLQVKDDGLGDIGGIARVKNVGSQSLTGTFTFTFFQSGTIVERRRDQPKRCLRVRPSLSNSSRKTRCLRGGSVTSSRWTSSSKRTASRVSGAQLARAQGEGGKVTGVAAAS